MTNSKPFEWTDELVMEFANLRIEDGYPPNSLNGLHKLVTERFLNEFKKHRPILESKSLSSNLSDGVMDVNGLLSTAICFLRAFVDFTSKGIKADETAKDAQKIIDYYKSNESNYKTKLPTNPIPDTPVRNKVEAFFITNSPYKENCYLLRTSKIIPEKDFPKIKLKIEAALNEDTVVDDKSVFNTDKINERINQLGELRKSFYAAREKEFLSVGDMLTNPHRNKYLTFEDYAKSIPLPTYSELTDTVVQDKKFDADKKMMYLSDEAGQWETNPKSLSFGKRRFTKEEVDTMMEKVFKAGREMAAKPFDGYSYSNYQDYKNSLQPAPVQPQEKVSTNNDDVACLSLNDIKWWIEKYFDYPNGISIEKLRPFVNEKLKQ